MKRITLIFVSCFLFCLNLSAQDVEGVAIDSSMTKVQVVEKFGEPEEYTLKNSYMDEEAKYEMYYYGHGEWLEFVNGCLQSFCVNTPRWSVLVYKMEGGIRVGDPFSKLSPLNPQLASWIKDNTDSKTYYIPSGDFPILIDVKEGKIKSVSFIIYN